ncbi:peptidase [Canariomyces notabilis]|uniref:Peptide hydrolase n=1 Tax=Canariomyces notabilis TaxID=2074819 RepID=A0AAN6QB88_9PEZI|nr:peptidase [Canariomyces arenarius]
MRFTTATLLSLALPSLVTATGGHGDHGHGKPLVDSTKLQSLVKTRDLLDGSHRLQHMADANGGTRAFGSAGHNATVDYVYKTLKCLDYYNVVKQPFTEIYSAGSGNLKVGNQSIATQIMTYTPGGEATAPILAVANLGCAVADFPADVVGKIALISRGTCSFAQKSLSAKAAGAVGAIIYNNVAGALSGTLGTPFLDYAPVVGISQEDGQSIIALLSQGAVTATLKIDATVEERVNFNVIAETKGGDHNNVLIVGGHSDSVPAGPGVNDDGSGIIGILTVAKALTKFRVNNAVRFAFSEMAKIRAYLNFDMIASPNHIYGIYDGDGNAFNLTGPSGSNIIEKDFEDFFKSKNTPSVPTAFSGRSDYAAFIENGIPSGGLFTGAEALKTEKEAALFGGQAGVAYDAFLLNTKAIANSVAKYAASFASLPAVNVNERRWEADRAKLLKRNVDTHGHAHVHSGPCGGGDLI